MIDRVGQIVNRRLIEHEWLPSQLIDVIYRRQKPPFRPQRPRDYNASMREAILAACWTGYAALLMLALVRALNRFESWTAAIAVLTIVGSIGGTMMFLLSQILMISQ